MSAFEIATLRLQHQRLAGNPLGTPEEVVGWLGAVQAQDYPGAKWGIAQRCREASDAGLDRLLAGGALIRTHVMRPTWHLVLQSDIRWLLALTGPRVKRAVASYDRKLEIDDALIGRCKELLVGALAGGRQLTRPELAAVLTDAGIVGTGQRRYHFLLHAELDAVICSGALRGKQFTYALFDERVPPAPPRPRDEALADLARRYVASHGPATAHDFGWWSGLTIGEARAALASVGSSLHRTSIDGADYWFVDAPTSAPSPAPLVHLLPNFDEHLVAYKDHAPSFDPAVYARRPTDDTLAAHIVVRRGLVAGGWRRTIGKREIAISTRLLVPFDEAERVALMDAAAAYGRFMGLPVVEYAVTDPA